MVLTWKVGYFNLLFSICLFFNNISRLILIYLQNIFLLCLRIPLCILTDPRQAMVQPPLPLLFKKSLTKSSAIQSMYPLHPTMLTDSASVCDRSKATNPIYGSTAFATATRGNFANIQCNTVAHYIQLCCQISCPLM